MASIHNIRHYQTATKYRDRPNLYRALVQRMVDDEKAGRSARLALQEAYAETHRPDPKGAA